MNLTKLPSEQLTGAATLLGRLKHDLGKYISLQARWLAPDASTQERHDALVSDLLHTRRGPAGSEAAHQVWGPFHRKLVGEEDLVAGVRVSLADDEGVAALGLAMAELAPVAEALAAGELPDEEVSSAMARCADVTRLCRELVKRARGLQGVKNDG